MANWVIQCNSLYFKHLTDYFHRELLKRKYLMMDETPIQVLHEPGRIPESKSYVWLMRSGNDGLPPIIYYRYAPIAINYSHMKTNMQNATTNPKL